jgi:hypothetical protein
VKESDIPLTSLTPTLIVNDDTLTIQDKNKKVLYTLMPPKYASSLKCKISHIQVSDNGQLQVIADPLPNSTPYHSARRQLPNNKILLWQSDPQKLECWHVSSGIQLNATQHLGTHNDCVFMVYKNRPRVLNAHPDFFTESNKSTDTGVMLTGSPIVIDALGSINVDCDYMALKYVNEHETQILLYESAAIKNTYTISGQVFFLFLSPDGLVQAQTSTGRVTLFWQDLPRRC